jgi:hypothetical protein
VITCFTFPWPPCVTLASTLTCHVGHNLQHPHRPRHCRHLTSFSPILNTALCIFALRSNIFPFESNFVFRLFSVTTCQNCRNLLEPVGTCRNLSELVRFFGLWSLFHNPLATLRHFCFHSDPPFQLQPPTPLQPTGGKHLMFALFGRNSSELVGT